jgi:hypothetical protein
MTKPLHDYRAKALTLTPKCLPIVPNRIHYFITFLVWTPDLVRKVIK